MKYDVNAYSTFLDGNLNPIAHTTYDTSALDAEERFERQLNSYVDSHNVVLKVNVSDMGDKFENLENIIDNYDLQKLGFNPGDKVKITIVPESYNELGQTEIHIRSEAKGEAPSLDSEKMTFFDNQREELREQIKKSIKETTLGFETEEKLKVYITQQYQFGLSFLADFYRRRAFLQDYGHSIDATLKSKKPNDTNSAILSFLISDLLGILKFIENNYRPYLTTEPIDVRQFEKKLFSTKDPKVKHTGKAKWPSWLNVDFLELKPNIAGIGLNLNEIINRIKNRK